MKTITENALRTTATGGRSDSGTASSPSTVALGSWIGEEREQVRDRDPAVVLAVVVDPAEVERGALLGLLEPLERGELHRLLLGDGAPRPVAHRAAAPGAARQATVSGMISAARLVVVALARAAAPPHRRRRRGSRRR